MAASLEDVITQMSSLVKGVGLLVQVAQEKFPSWQPVPPTASSPGTPGMVSYDGTHFYVCVATNTWMRSTLTTF